MDQSQSLLDIFLPEYFGPPARNVEYTLARKVKEAHGDMEHIAILDAGCPLPSYLQTQNIEVKLTDKHRVHKFDQAQNKLFSTIKSGKSEFTWMGTEFIAYKFTWTEPMMGMPTMYVVLFQGSERDEEERDKAGKDLLTSAYKWSLALKEEMWMFSGGCWSKDKKLWKTIQMAGWDNLVLDQEFVAGLKRDTETFFSSREIYESLGIPWKRGILLLGPAGNGKTESIKVLLKESQIPSLYVKSFTTNAGEEAGIRAIFEFARTQAPCILVLEDLDSMVTPAVRSFFLNELDGLEKNEGILTIATSNHPERIDDAILNRPSRFDVKYTFELPSYDLRKTYIDKWIIKTRDVNGIDFKDEAFVNEMAEQTNGFSFAFMKELFVSFLLRVAHDKATGKEPGDPESIMKAQLKQLVAQIEIGKNAQSDGTPVVGVQQNSGSMRMQRARPGYMNAPMVGTDSGTAGW